MTVTLVNGDAARIPLPDNVVDTVITDPPYGLEFMGKEWDHGVPGVPFWREIARVAKPGAMLLAFGGTRTHHRLMVAIEDAGWELRDTMMWLYGSGFPKSYDISKGMDKAAGAEREVVESYESSYPQMIERDNERTRKDGEGFDRYEGVNGLTAPATPEAETWDGWGTALKPAWEPIIVAMNPREDTFVNNALKWGVSGIWIDGGRVAMGDETWEKNTSDTAPIGKDMSRNVLSNHSLEEIEKHSHPQGRWPANLLLQHHPDCEFVGTKRVGGGERKKSGWRDGGGDGPSVGLAGTKNAPDSYGKETVEDWRCHPDCPVRILAEQSGDSGAFAPVRRGHDGKSNGIYGDFAQKGDDGASFYDDSGTAARFFYTAKASRSERTCDGKVDNDHPTVKPVEIMRYLVRLTKTPTGGVVLDPFGGSGSTAIACMHEQRDCIIIDNDWHACEIARERVKYTVVQPQLL